MFIDTDIYVSKDCAFEYAKQFKSRTEISKNNNKFYRFIIKNKWIDDYYWLTSRNIKWDYETTYKEAQKYTTKKDFERYSSGAYTKCIRNGWMKDYHWLKDKPYIKYTYDFCYDIASKCESATEMFNYCSGAYRASVKHGWNKDYVWFKRKVVNVIDEKRKQYFIYAYFDNINKFVYIGLTKTNKRDKQHRDEKIKDTVFLYFNQHNLDIPNWTIIESNLTAKEATLREHYWLNYYIENGWNKINRTHTGSLGAGNYKWTKDAILVEAQKYGSKYEFYKNSPGAYSAALKNKLIDTITWLNPPFRWTMDLAINEAKKYKSITELYKHKSGLHQYLKRNNMLYIIFPKKDIVNKDEVIKISKQYTYLSDFKNNHKSLYTYCVYKKWLREFVWLKRKNEPSMSKEKCIDESKKYKNKKDFKTNNITAYNYAKKHKLLRDMHWLSNCPKKRNMTNEQCIELSKQFSSTKDFKINNYSAYRYAIRYKLLTNMHWLYN